MVCTAAGNVFYYSGTANQTIGAPAAGYYHLTLRRGGTKTASAMLDVNGDLTITGVTLAGGTNAFDVEGSITMTGASSVTGSGVVNVNTNVTMSNTAGWSATGTANIVGSLNMSALPSVPTWTGNGALNVTGNFNLGGGTYSGNGNIAIGTNFNVSGGTYSGTGTIDVNGNIDITSGAINGTNSVNVAGNWSAVSAASFDQASRTVTFDGSGSMIANTAGETFYNLVINTGAAANTVTLQNNITVTNTLTLTRGRLTLNSRTLNITRSNTGAISGGSANAHIVSESTATPYAPIVWSTGATNGTFTFPFGYNGNYIPYQLVKTVGTSASGTVSVATYHTAANNTPYPSTVTHTQNVAGVDQSTLVVDRFWIVNTANYPSLTASQNLQFVASESASATTPRTAQRWNGTNTWTAGVGSSNVNPYPVPSANLATSSIWVVASVSAALPVELVSFSAKLLNDQVLVSWKTATEKDNDYFTVERTQDLEQFSQLERIPGQGTTNQVHSYSYIDDLPVYGRSYYRLRQTDFDGSNSFSKIEVVDYAGPEFPVLYAYPNPGDGNFLQVEAVGLKEMKVLPVQILDAKGITVWEGTLPVTNKGRLKQDLSFSTPLPAGLYILKAGPTSLLTRKIVIK